jgi:hypothetical protein
MCQCLSIVCVCDPRVTVYEGTVLGCLSYQRLLILYRRQNNLVKFPTVMPHILVTEEGFHEIRNGSYIYLFLLLCGCRGKLYSYPTCLSQTSLKHL